jgi:hypothetical protein
MPVTMVDPSFQNWNVHPNFSKDKKLQGKNKHLHWSIRMKTILWDYDVYTGFCMQPPDFVNLDQAGQHFLPCCRIKAIALIQGTCTLSTPDFNQQVWGQPVWALDSSSNQLWICTVLRAILCCNNSSVMSKWLTLWLLIITLNKLTILLLSLLLLVTKSISLTSFTIFNVVFLWAGGPLCPILVLTLIVSSLKFTVTLLKKCTPILSGRKVTPSMLSRRPTLSTNHYNSCEQQYQPCYNNATCQSLRPAYAPPTQLGGTRSSLASHATNEGQTNHREADCQLKHLEKSIAQLQVQAWSRHCDICKILANVVQSFEQEPVISLLIYRR